MQIKNFGLLKILTLFAYSFYFLLNLFECYICYIGKHIIYDITFDPAFIFYTRSFNNFWSIFFSFIKILLFPNTYYFLCVIISSANINIITSGYYI